MIQWSSISDDLEYLKAKKHSNKFWLSPRFFIDNIIDGKLRTMGELVSILWKLEPMRLSRLIMDINENGIKLPVAVERAYEITDNNIYKIADGHHRVTAAIALDIDIPISIFSRKLRTRD